MSARSTGARRRSRRAGTSTAESGSSVRGKYTFVTSCRFAEQAHARERQRGGEVLHRQDAGDDEARVGRAARREVRELPEHDHVDRRGEDGHEERPGDRRGTSACSGRRCRARRASRGARGKCQSSDSSRRGQRVAGLDDRDASIAAGSLPRSARKRRRGQSEIRRQLDVGVRSSSDARSAAHPVDASDRRRRHLALRRAPRAPSR